MFLILLIGQEGETKLTHLAMLVYLQSIQEDNIFGKFLLVKVYIL